MPYHTKKKLMRRELKNALVSNLPYEEEQCVRLELAIRLLDLNRDNLIEYESNAHQWKPEMAAGLATLTRKHIMRLERIIALARSGYGITGINVMGDPPEVR